MPRKRRGAASAGLISALGQKGNARGREGVPPPPRRPRAPPKAIARRAGGVLARGDPRSRMRLEEMPSPGRRPGGRTSGTRPMPEQIQPSSEQRVRFVVLMHTDREGVHFDLMVDTGELLATWKCPRPPETAAESDLSCIRLKDHRRQYLDYEGAVSGDRGEVRRHDQGACVVHRQAPQGWELTFHGHCLVGRFALEPVSAVGSEWCLRSLPSS